jgi:hypothetical protein
VFPEAESGALQITAPEGSMPFEEVDAGQWSEARLQGDLGLRVRRPFDLDQGPLLRVTLYRHG